MRIEVADKGFMQNVDFPPNCEYIAFDPVSIPPGRFVL